VQYGKATPLQHGMATDAALQCSMASAVDLRAYCPPLCSVCSKLSSMHDNSDNARHGQPRGKKIPHTGDTASLFRIEIWTFSFQICFKNQFSTSGSGQTENTRIHIYVYFPFDHFSKLKTDF
jgi:hypothetical protein